MSERSATRERPRPGPTVVAVVGAGGDLAARKLLPALYNLFLDGWLPDQFAAIGVDRAQMDDGAFRRRAKEAVDRFSRRGPADANRWNAFAPALTHFGGDLASPAAGRALGAAIAALERWWGTAAQRIFYLATPPAAVEPIVEGLGGAALAPERARLVVEKPFGQDLQSARALTAAIGRVFPEGQIFRIDHYLGKETVQNILALRFGNTLYEPVWNRRYIDQVQITVAETVGVEHRGAYYDHAGALRDMVQNHMLQVLCLVAMEPPVSFDADEVRTKKTDVLRAVRPLTAGVDASAVRGQYGPGRMDGAPVPGYREEPGIAAGSTTETFAALRLFVDNWRWQGVPFYLRTGKRLPVKATEVQIQFQPAPHLPFPPSAVEHWEPNRLIVRIQPAEGIVLRFQAKRPGPVMHLDVADMDFDYRRGFGGEPPEAYETLLLDVMWGDATLFMRADQIDASWSIVQPVLDAWRTVPPGGVPVYAAGSWGPQAAELLPARDGRAWCLPSLAEARTHGS
ncbi:MAG TPA: glucose-6-phosphate dehydrogenase [bacterium]|nr:glucose-6-phosphate dehydrogenase [bacterium]